MNGGDHGADPFSFENKPVPKDMKIKMKSMKITVGYNKSDTTYGWNGFQNTFTLFYVHKSLEKSFSTMSSHSHPLIPGISYFNDLQILPGSLLVTQYVAYHKA